MDHETRFRIVLVAGFVAMVVITGYHRMRAGATREPLDRRKEGFFILATLRPIALFLYVGVFAYMINPAWMTWSSLPLPEWLRWTGAFVFVIGLAFLTWTLRSLGTNLTDTVVTRKAHTLVTQGPYRWVRHPFYDAMALFILAMALLAANWFMLISGAVVFILLGIRSATEEAHLSERFGEPYQTYRDNTGRFFPKLRSTTR
ncbi:MAG: isoprenylcysteine carboxylmethyltransferase family protein [Gemmatimonadaceae bacterium]